MRYSSLGKFFFRAFSIVPVEIAVRTGCVAFTIVVQLYSRIKSRDVIIVAESKNYVSAIQF